MEKARSEIVEVVVLREDGKHHCWRWGERKRLLLLSELLLLFELLLLSEGAGDREE